MYHLDQNLMGVCTLEYCTHTTSTYRYGQNPDFSTQKERYVTRDAAQVRSADEIWSGRRSRPWLPSLKRYVRAGIVTRYTGPVRCTLVFWERYAVTAVRYGRMGTVRRVQ